MQIIGAGLAGLLAANIFHDATVIEAGPEDQITHRAVLRFRSRAVGDAVGIDFREVTVHKGIFIGGGFSPPAIDLANAYSKKVIGSYADRSIWSVDPVSRFVAPGDFASRLAERCRRRIIWNTPVDDGFFLRRRPKEDGPVVSTIPMPALVEFFHPQPVHSDEDIPRFRSAPIRVKRWRVRDADVFQTIYFPAGDVSLYRASITGDLLIAEFSAQHIESVEDDGAMSMEEMTTAFGIGEDDLTPIDDGEQRFGKIVPINDDWRRRFILRMTLEHNIYSLGRYATWRNVLLDDVLSDIAVVKRLISVGPYGLAKTI